MEGWKKGKKTAGRYFGNWGVFSQHEKTAWLATHLKRTPKGKRGEALKEGGKGSDLYKLHQKRVSKRRKEREN